MSERDEFEMAFSDNDDDSVSDGTTPSTETPEQPLISSSSSLAAPRRLSFSGCAQQNSLRAAIQEKRPLRLLDLPMDILKEVIKEMTDANDLASLALTCSALHALAIPCMYSSFDIVWPDSASLSDNEHGVDALSYGLSTLVMGEDIFSHLPPSVGDESRSSTCPTYGGHSRQAASLFPLDKHGTSKMRRGNFYAQYTRKFAVGNGPSAWVQEYSVTKESGKMLGTLVALAVARMINLESFIWDMPTGVLRDVWIALSSLADRPGHECRLERVWVRWHDNSENAPRSAPDYFGAAGTGSVGGPRSPHSYATNRLQKYAHVEYPTLSVLPPLKSLTVLDIDEPSYLDEMAVLIERSRNQLRELRIGISVKAFQATWLVPVGNRAPDPTADMSSGWPRPGGVLSILLSQAEHTAGQDDTLIRENLDPEDHVAMRDTLQGGRIRELPTPHKFMQETTEDKRHELENSNVGHDALTPGPDSEHAHVAPNYEAASTIASVGQPTLVEKQETKSHPQLPHRALKRSRKTISSSSSRVVFQPLQLETLELHRVHLCVSYTYSVLDWTKIRTLTILRCENHEKLWRSLRRQYMPSVSKTGHGKADLFAAEYPLKIKHLHTDAVSPYLLLFIKDAIAPNTLESVFLQEGPSYESNVNVDALYRNVIRRHRLSLKVVLIDSSERSATWTEVPSARWRKWMFNREMITFVTSGRLPHLQELGMAVQFKDWHFLLQRLPYICQLRALYISHISQPILRDPKELALQILDIVTIRPELGLRFIGIRQKCYEIIESKNRDTDEESEDRDHDPSDASNTTHELDSNADDGWGDTESEDDADVMGVGAIPDSVSDTFSHNDASDDDDIDLDSCLSSLGFRLSEMLYHDEKTSIFRARQGVL